MELIRAALPTGEDVLSNLRYDLPVGRGDAEFIPISYSLNSIKQAPDSMRLLMSGQSGNNRDLKQRFDGLVILRQMMSGKDRWRGSGQRNCELW